MVEEAQQSSAPETPSPAVEQQAEGQVPSTPEEVETYWRKRQGNSDKAHSEETRVLREALSKAEAAAAANVAAGAKGDDVAVQQQQRITQLERQVQQSEAQRITDTRRAMYPAAADALADNNLIASMDEARLAALNTKLTDEGPPSAAPRLDGNNPARSPVGAPPKALSEMTADELKQVMADSSQQWVDEVRAQGG